MFRKHLYPKYTHRAGFSLIEVLVSLSIFAVVMTVAIGALMALISTNARTQNMHSVMTNVSYALDSMTREIRTGTDYFCGTDSSLPDDGVTVRDCSNGGPAFSYNEGGVSLTADASSRRVGYRLHNAAIERRLGNGGWLPITAPEIEIVTMRFVVTGSTRGDALSPTATLYIRGKAGDAEDKSEAYFDIQTTVVQQLLDV